MTQVYRPFSSVGRASLYHELLASVRVHAVLTIHGLSVIYLLYITVVYNIIAYNLSLISDQLQV